MWMIPTLYVMLSNCYFTYHYVTFMLTAIIEIWISLNRKLDIFKKQSDSPILIIYIGTFILCSILSYVAKPIVFYKHINLVLEFIGVLLLAAFFGICLLKKDKKGLAMNIVCGYVFVIYFTYSALFNSNTLAYIDLTNSAYSNDFSLPAEDGEQILYLDAGDGAYYFGYDTYYEEYYPLILQRIDEDSEKSKLQRYVEASEMILSYSGNYICLTDDEDLQGMGMVHDAVNGDILRKRDEFVSDLCGHNC